MTLAALTLEVEGMAGGHHQKNGWGTTAWTSGSLKATASESRVVSMDIQTDFIRRGESKAVRISSWWPAFPSYKINNGQIRTLERGETDPRTDQ